MGGIDLFNYSDLKMNKYSTFLLLLICLMFTACNSNYLELKQKITSNKEHNYAFYMDTFGIGDQGYFVLELKKNVQPEDVYVEINIEGINREQSDWVEERTILFNYAEAGFHYENPNIELIGNRHLVFSRGGFFYGLYDLKIRKDTFNIYSPWHQWLEKSGYSSSKKDKNREKALYEKWVRENIHSKIEFYIDNNS